MVTSRVKDKVLLEKTKKVFAKKYGRVISDQEAEEIMVNLVAFMEVFVKKEYNLI